MSVRLRETSDRARDVRFWSRLCENSACASQGAFALHLGDSLGRTPPTALANKMTRVAWAMLRHGTNYEPERVAVAA
jgi:hypothetical protein